MCVFRAPSAFCQGSVWSLVILDPPGQGNNKAIGYCALDFAPVPGMPSISTESPYCEVGNLAGVPAEGPLPSIQEIFQ
jgi:hypothetical protein